MRKFNAVHPCMNIVMRTAFIVVCCLPRAAMAYAQEFPSAVTTTIESASPGTGEKAPLTAFIRNEDWAFYAGSHIRMSGNVLDNTVDLRERNYDDYTYYAGYAYDFTFDLRHVLGFETYAFVERRGRADYDAPLYGRDKINSLFGTYYYYRQSDFLPYVRQLWGVVPLSSTYDVTAKIGLFPYGREIGNRIALGGKYENYGVTVSGVTELADWNVHWEIEDHRNRILMGKVPSFEQIVNRYNVPSAYFTAADATIKLGRSRIQTYAGWLNDRTSDNARASVFATPVKSENLVTLGFYTELRYDDAKLGLEMAKNFGQAKTTQHRRFDHVEHTGYLIVGDASCKMGSFTPKTKLFIASGNKLDGGNFRSPLIPGNKNNAFSVFSPLNTNLTDTHYQKQFGPYVAMAGGYAVNFGVRRPGTFGDPFIFENLVAYTAGFDYTPIDKVYFGFDFWLLQSKEKGYGLDERGSITPLSRDLGQEFDIFASYQLKKDTKLSLLAGYFLPGQYYKTKRTDTARNNIFSSTPARNGKADGAYQIELGLDMYF